MTQTFKSDEIAKIINGKCTHSNVLVSKFASLDNADDKSVSFFVDKTYKNFLARTKAALVILKESDSSFFSGPSIYVDDPYLAYAKIAKLFVNDFINEGVHETAVISKTAKLGEMLSIGAHSFLGDDVIVGNNTRIGSNCYIGSKVILGSNLIIHPNVYIGDRCTLGDNCEIFPGTVIGSDGFGYAKDNKKWLKIPQVGTVRIGKNVDIGSNTTIDRGAIQDTVICDGVKIDNLVQIGHNCELGENTIIAGCTGIAGSTKIGKNCMIGGAAMIKGHITIADDTIISGGTGIGKNVENPGKRFTNVFPYNIEHKDWLRIANNLKNIGKKND